MMIQNVDIEFIFVFDAIYAPNTFAIDFLPNSVHVALACGLLTSFYHDVTLAQLFG